MSKQWHGEELRLFNGIVYKVRGKLEGGKVPELFARYLVDHREEFELVDYELAYLAGADAGCGFADLLLLRALSLIVADL